MASSKLAATAGVSLSPQTTNPVTAIPAPTTENTLSTWSGPAQLIDRVVTTSPSTTPTGAGSHTITPVAPTAYTRYTLQGILLFCGIKQHRVQQTVDHMIAQLLAATFAPSSVSPSPGSSPTTPTPAPSLFLTTNTSSSEDKTPHCNCAGAAPGTSACPASLSLLVRDWLALSNTATAQANPTAADHHHHHHHHHSLHHLPRRYQLHVPAALWERTIIKALGSELRGQMLSLRPLLRWTTACAAQAGRAPVVILIGGTSGTGKSTLARLVASQLRIPNVLSTDTVRQVLRARLVGREADYPTLFASTYEAYKAIGPSTGNEPRQEEVVSAYVAQCTLILQVLDGMLRRLLRRGESVVVEGVHLLPHYLTAKRAALLVERVTCVPVLVQIPKADGHLERFCVRARGMSLQSNHNKYIASFHAIRAIQTHLVAAVEDAALPVLVLSNTNVDKSFLVLHHAVLETMEHTALHGWPADAAATAQVPLTPLAFAATKRRLVAVVRQRRAHHRNATADPVRRGAPSAATPSTVFTAATSTADGAHGGSGAFATPDGASSAVVNGLGGGLVPSRARSADLLSTIPRRLAEHHQHPSFRSSASAAGVHADLLNARHRPPDGTSKTEGSGSHHSGAPLSSLLSSATSAAVPVHVNDVFSGPTEEDAKADAAPQPSVNGAAISPYLATAPRRSTTAGIFQPASLNARHMTQVTEEEAFDELDVPSLMGS